MSKRRVVAVAKGKYTVALKYSSPHKEGLYDWYHFVKYLDESGEFYMAPPKMRLFDTLKEAKLAAIELSIKNPYALGEYVAVKEPLYKLLWLQ